MMRMMLILVWNDMHGALTLARPSQTDGTDELWNSHSRSLKVIHCCANRRCIWLPVST